MVTEHQSGLRPAFQSQCNKFDTILLSGPRSSLSSKDNFWLLVASDPHLMDEVEQRTKQIETTVNVANRLSQMDNETPVLRRVKTQAMKAPFGELD